MDSLLSNISSIFNDDDIDEEVLNKQDLLQNLSDKGYQFCKLNYKDCLSESIWHEILTVIINNKLEKLIEEHNLAALFKENKETILIQLKTNGFEYIETKSFYLNPKKKRNLITNIKDDKDLNLFFEQNKSKAIVLVPLISSQKNEKNNEPVEEQKNNIPNESLDEKVSMFIDEFCSQMKNKFLIFSKREDNWEEEEQNYQNTINLMLELKVNQHTIEKEQFQNLKEYLKDKQELDYSFIFENFSLDIKMISSNEEEHIFDKKRKPYELIFIVENPEKKLYRLSKYQYLANELKDDIRSLFYLTINELRARDKHNLVYVNMIIEYFLKKMIALQTEIEVFEKENPSIIVDLFDYQKDLLEFQIAKHFSDFITSYKNNLVLKKELIFGNDCQYFSYSYLKKKKNDLLKKYHPDKLHMRESQELAYQINIIFSSFNEISIEKNIILEEEKGDSLFTLHKQFQNDAERKEFYLFHAKECYYEACLIADKCKIYLKQISLRRKLGEVYQIMGKNFEFIYYISFGALMLQKIEKKQLSNSEKAILESEKKIFQSILKAYQSSKDNNSNNTSYCRDLQLFDENAVSLVDNKSICYNKLMQASTLVTINTNDDLVLRSVTKKKEEEFEKIIASHQTGLVTSASIVATGLTSLAITGFQIGCTIVEGATLQTALVSVIGSVAGTAFLGIGLLASIGVGIYFLCKTYKSIQEQRQIEALMKDFNQRFKDSFDLIEKNKYHEFLLCFSKEFEYPLPKSKKKQLLQYNQTERKNNFFNISFSEFGEDLSEIGLRPDVILYLLHQIFNAITNLNIKNIPQKKITNKELYEIGEKILEEIISEPSNGNLNYVLLEKAKECDHLITKDESNLSQKLTYKEKLYSKWYGISEVHMKSAKRMLIRERLENYKLLAYFNYATLRIFLDLENFIECEDTQNVLYDNIKQCMNYYKKIKNYEFLCDILIDSKIQIMRNLVYAFSNQQKIEEFENLIKTKEGNNNQSSEQISLKEQILRILIKISYGDMCKIKIDKRQGEKFLILSIDGGGIRGIIALVILCEIEKRSQRFISKSFNLIGGTSIGAIISGCLVCPNPQNNSRPKFLAGELLHNILFNSDLIFKKRNFLISLLTSKAKYDSKALKEILSEFLENTKINAALADILVPTCVANETNIFTNKNSEHLIKDIVMASASAPTYFDPYEIDMKKHVDGGVTRNNPAEELYNHAVNNLHVDPKNIVMISIGTGHKNGRLPEGLFGWAVDGISYTIEAQVIISLFNFFI